MDKIKKRILLVRHGTIANNENGPRRWTVVDFWNNTSHPESAL